MNKTDIVNQRNDAAGTTAPLFLKLSQPGAAETEYLHGFEQSIKRNLRAACTPLTGYVARYALSARFPFIQISQP